MTYTIGEMAKLLDVAPSTLRYYDKEGLLPFVERGESGYRVFSDENIRTLCFIECLKTTGMAIKDIQTFFEWVREVESTMQKRYDMFLKQRGIVEEQSKQLQKTLEVIDYKCAMYEHAIKIGAPDINADAPEIPNPLDSN